tara:strand:+ start:638 stop:808 length:171 start_codon:yes stop_codon:yes gene_type:complete
VVQVMVDHKVMVQVHLEQKTVVAVAVAWVVPVTLEEDMEDLVLLLSLTQPDKYLKT